MALQPVMSGNAVLSTVSAMMKPGAARKGTFTMWQSKTATPLAIQLMPVERPPHDLKRVQTRTMTIYTEAKINPKNGPKRPQNAPPEG
jgi:hypothetical protein